MTDTRGAITQDLGNGLAKSRILRPRHGRGFTGLSRRDIFALLAVILPAILGDKLRIFGGSAYALCVLLAALSLGRGVSRRNIRDALIFATIVLVYCGLSYLQVLPRGWTVMRQPQAIFRQAMPLIGFCVMLVAFGRFWERIFDGTIDNVVLWRILMCLLVVGSILDLILGGQPLSRVAGTLRNSTLIFLVITSHLAYQRRGIFLMLIPFVYVAAAIVSAYVQTRGFYLMAALLLSLYAWRVNLSKVMIIAFVTIILSATTYTLISFSDNDYAQLWLTDHNTAWRLVFWRDIFRSTMLTSGVGVGFGTEALVNIYPYMPRPIFIADPAFDPNFLLIGTHNAFTDALLRCGVIGFGALCWIFLNSVGIMRRVFGPSLAISFCGAFLCAFVNVALQSPLYSVGIAFALSYCRASGSIMRPAGSKTLNDGPPTNSTLAQASEGSAPTSTRL